MAYDYGRKKEFRLRTKEEQAKQYFDPDKYKQMQSSGTQEEKPSSSINPGLAKGIQASVGGASPVSSIAQGLAMVPNPYTLTAAIALQTMDANRKARQQRANLKASLENKQRQQQISVLGDLMNASQRLGV